MLGSITARLILPADVDKDSSLTAGTFKCTHEKHYKLTVAKGSAHMLRALRVREMNGGGDSAQVRRILRAQGRLPEVKGSQGPQGFSRWDDAVDERLKGSDSRTQTMKARMKRKGCQGRTAPTSMMCLTWLR